ncbi:type II toxin-antitoxin system VapC family toxin [Isoptericola sp. NPDC057391]|uniref:type II toxin-antitoxin system VapC family toxin n=1 Tax=Isoptericola sp. NPDC057391 TaxID=3346117 RepID=UPI003638C55A
MIVVDASAMVEALIGRDADPELLDALADDLHAPHLLDVEVLSVLRGLTLAGKLVGPAADDARADYFALTIVRHEIEALADRVWELRQNFTTYDAAYLSLAEALGAPLLTCDHKLIGTAHRADVRVFPRAGTA